MRKFFIIILGFLGVFEIDAQKKIIISEVDVETIYSPEDLVIIKERQESSKQFYEKCQRENRNCIIDGGFTQVVFWNGGYEGLRKLFFKNIKIPKKLRPQNIKVKIKIGRKNNIQSFEILDNQNIIIYNEIKRILELKPAQEWQSASEMGIDLESYVSLEINVF